MYPFRTSYLIPRLPSLTTSLVPTMPTSSFSSSPPASSATATATPPPLVIIGGGLGRLALAIGLLKHGVAVHIYEAAGAFSEIGAGVVFGVNGGHGAASARRPPVRRVPQARDVQCWTCAGGHVCHGAVRRGRGGPCGWGLFESGYGHGRCIYTEQSDRVYWCRPHRERVSSIRHRQTTTHATMYCAQLRCWVGV